ncbi:hypothetical protein Vafri_20756 [Volvox africanus]|uniref:Protein kinase domain-containing protein n=1 Tax=Volvox africanus TaxID=51714 RepID=A0A8J4BS08_9CHLO|nr:hypothetical protein Vafri_20756 [Volvox africanus]
MTTATTAAKTHSSANPNKKNPNKNSGTTRQQRTDPGLLRPSRTLSQAGVVIHRAPAPPPEPRPASRSARPRLLEVKRAPHQDDVRSCSTPDITTPKDPLINLNAKLLESGPPSLRHATNRPLAQATTAATATAAVPIAAAAATAAAATAAEGIDEDPLRFRSQSARGEGSAAGASGSGDGPGGEGGGGGRSPKPKVQLVEPPTPCNPYMARVEGGGRYSFQAAESCLKPECYSRVLWDYHQEVELGHGNFSKVYRAVHRLTGVPFAIKTNRSPITTLQARNMWLNEMQALAAVQGHPHIVRLHDAWFESDPRNTGERVFIKMELCGDSLGGLVRRRLQLSEQGALDLLRQRINQKLVRQSTLLSPVRTRTWSQQPRPLQPCPTPSIVHH